MRKKIGIFGGTFNPIHNGHIHLADGFRQKLGLDCILVIPVWSPPHKSGEEIIPGEARLEMCRLACSDKDWLVVSDIEVLRKGKSYTIDTINALSVLYKDADFYLLMGADMFVTLESWRGFGEIAHKAALCCVSRHDGELNRLNEYAEKLKKCYSAQCFVENIPVVEVSSTEIRDKLSKGIGTDSLIPAGVLNYIKKNRLYGV